MIPLSLFITDFCSSWFLWWILPFVLGALLGYSIYAKWKTLYEEEQIKNLDLNNKVSNLQSEIDGITTNESQNEVTVTELKEKLVQYERMQRITKSELRAKNQELVKLKEGSTHKEIQKSDKLKVKEVSKDSNSHQKESQPSESPSQSNYGVQNIATPFAAIPLAQSPSSVDDTGKDVIDLDDTNPVNNKEKNTLEDNMQIIEGIGPQMESVLYENGIHNWQQLSQYQWTDIKEILNKYGSKYTMINPKHWPEQAKLAVKGKWQELIAYQKSIYPNISTTKSKAKAYLTKVGLIQETKSTNTNLQVFEGIGSEVEAILKIKGIDTWEELAVTPIVKLRGILEEADPALAAINPTSWPKQAQLGLVGKTQMLEEYQEFLRSNS